MKTLKTCLWLTALIALLATTALTPLPAMGATLFVRASATGANNGTSWANAYTTLQPAITATISRDEIWVAQGTYYPSEELGGTGSRYQSFQMKNRVAIRGGFAGTENPASFNLDTRDFSAHETILSGDIGTPMDNSDNCYHVFYHPGLNLDETAVLDGFTITGGNANGPSEEIRRGGGMYNWSSSPTVSHCTFSWNSAGDYGGGISNWESSSPTVSNCTFSNNSAGYSGGGISTWGSSSPTVTHCTFSSNGAGAYGGGISNGLSSPTVLYCTFSSNSAGDYGGGISNWESSSPTVTHCTFSSNSAGDGGGGIYNWGSSSPTVAHCILWDDTTNEIYNEAESSPLVTYSLISGGYAGAGNIDQDPRFVESGSHPLSLSYDSPCINAGDPAITTAQAGDTDFAGNPRISGGRIDMGAYEFTDNDGDGLSDYEEDHLHLIYPNFSETNPELWDSDDDQFSDGIEVSHGFDPNDREAHPDLPIPEPARNIIEDGVVSLQVNAFQGIGATVHLSTEWRVVHPSCPCPDGNCGGCETVYSIKQQVYPQDGSGPFPCTQVQIPLLVFAGQGIWQGINKWQARFKIAFDGEQIYSDWSSIGYFSFVYDNDPHEGVDDTTDLDHDGTWDKDQVGMVITRTFDNLSEVSVKADSQKKWEFKAIQAIRPTSMDERYAGHSDYLPFGLISFKVDDLKDVDTINATIYFAVPLPDDSRLFYYDPDTGMLDVMDDAEFNHTMTAVSVSITDGGDGDSDGSKNGSITHISGVNIDGEDSLIDKEMASDSDVDVGGVGCFIDSTASGL